MRRGTAVDHASTVLALAGLSVPQFWLGILLILFFAVRLRWLPASGYVPVSENPLRALYYLTLPAVILGTGLAAVVMRQTRSSMLETLSTDYVRTARAKGLTENVIMLKHVLRNAMIPILTNVAVALPGIFVGSFLIEVFFSIPGLGREILLAVNRSDYPVIQAFAIYIAVISMLVNLLTDVLYTMVDPRVVLK